YGKARWPESLGLTYRSLVEEGRTVYDGAVEAACVGLGWQTYEANPDVRDGAREVLEALRPRARLVLATRGDEDLQGRRLDHSGLRGHFDALYFLERKTRETYGAILAEQGF